MAQLRRRYALSGVAAGVSVVLAACAPGGVSGGADAGSASRPTVGNRDVTLSWQVEMLPDQLAQVPTFLAEWTQRYPRIKVEAQHFGGNDADKVQKMLTLAAGSTPVDVVGKLTYIQPLAAPGAARSIESLVKRDRYDLSKYNQNWLKTFGTYEGQLYSIPYGMGGNAMVWVYNRDHFLEAGLKEPAADWKQAWTYDEYRQTAQKLTKRGADTLDRAGTDQFGNVNYTVPLPYGGVWLKDHKTVGCDSPEMQEAYTRFLDLLHRDRTTAISPGAEGLGAVNQRFFDGRVSMHYIVGSQLPNFTDPAKFRVNYAMAPFPKGSLPSSPDVDTNQLALANKASVEESWAFVKWLLDKARYAWFTNRLPPLAEDATAWSKENFKALPPTARVEVLVNGLTVARPNDPMRSHPRAAEISQEVHVPFWNDMLSQRASVRDALTDAKRKLQGIIGA